MDRFYWKDERVPGRMKEARVRVNERTRGKYSAGESRG